MGNGSSKRPDRDTFAWKLDAFIPDLYSALFEFWGGTFRRYVPDLRQRLDELALTPEAEDPVVAEALAAMSQFAGNVETRLAEGTTYQEYMALRREFGVRICEGFSQMISQKPELVPERRYCYLKRDTRRFKLYRKYLEQEVDELFLHGDELTPEEKQAALEHATLNRAEINRSTMAVCFHCGETFPASSVDFDYDEKQTAACHLRNWHGNRDTVIGDASGLELSKYAARQIDLVCGSRLLEETSEGAIWEISFRGTCVKPGSRADLCVSRMDDHIRQVLGKHEPSAILFNLADFLYQAGDAICFLNSGTRLDREMSCCVASGQTELSLRPLVDVNSNTLLRGWKLVNSVEAGVEVLRQRLREGRD